MTLVEGVWARGKKLESLGMMLGLESSLSGWLRARAALEDEAESILSTHTWTYSHL